MTGLMARRLTIENTLSWKRLEMLRDANDGEGPLAEPLRALRGRLDLTNVGLMGHSRGGRGVAWQAADIRAADLPRGVRLRAAVPLDPADLAVTAHDLDARMLAQPVCTPG
ncbi:hypothetical protein [Streptomyces malaysiensis]|uniref:hypothetical protein n=1 Tax=Streptomyces malaysiensis TaxID=92644 RepID=UPI00384B244A